jgi:ribosomal protein S18 acetylase RimI-like enzyme
MLLVEGKVDHEREVRLELFVQVNTQPALFTSVVNIRRSFPALSCPLRIAMDIAVATLDDVPELATLLGVLLAQEAEFAPDIAAQQRGLSVIIRNPATGMILVARMEQKIVAMVNILFTVSTALGARVGILEDMVVDPAARGSGIGSQLLDAAIARARECGCRRLTLLTDHDNAPAQRFYQRHGFTRSTMLPFRLSLQ